MLQFLKIVCMEFVPSHVHMCPEFLSSGGYLVLLTSGVKPQTFAVSVTAHKSSTSGIVRCFWWVPGLPNLKSKTADHLGEYYSS